MKFNKFYVSALLGWATLILTPGCTDEVDLRAPETPAGSALTLRFAVSGDAQTESGSRAAGDNNYDDNTKPHPELGFSNEWSLNNALIVIYNAPINSARGEGQVVKTIYFDNLGNPSVDERKVNADYYPTKGGASAHAEENVQLAHSYSVEKDNLLGIDALFEGKSSDYHLYAVAIGNAGDLSNASVAAAAGGSDPITVGMDVYDLGHYVYKGELYQGPQITKNVEIDVENQVDVPYTPQNAANPTDEDKNHIINLAEWEADHNVTIQWGTVKQGNGTYHKETRLRGSGWCNNFVMSGINEIEIPRPTVDIETVGDTRTTTTTLDLSDRPFIVQRLAARLDISFGIQAVESAEWNAEGYWTGGRCLHYVDDTKVYRNISGEDVPSLYSINGGPNPLAVGDVYYPYDVDVTAAASIFPAGYRFPLYDEQVYQATGKFRRITGVLFWLTDIKILNAVNSGSYMFQQSSGTPAVLGNEGAWVNGYPTKFVPSYNPAANIGDRHLCGNVTDGVAGSVGRPVPFIQENLKFEGRGQYKIFSILGYVGENTYQTYDANNKYTTVQLTGFANFDDDHFSDAADDKNHGYQMPYTVTYRIRHSSGECDTPDSNHLKHPNTSNPLCFGVVRNTVYRTFIQFFYNGNSIVVREYYYNNTTHQYEDVAFEDADFYEHIVENPNGPSHD